VNLEEINAIKTGICISSVEICDVTAVTFNMDHFL
jgi:hypothetical protein